VTVGEETAATVLDRGAISETAKRPLSASPRPFLKWAGSKRYLLPVLVNLLPDSYGTYWEPFLGGGSLFFLLAPTRAVISDSAKPLIETYRAVRDDVEAVIQALPSGDDKQSFYRVRATSPNTPVQRAARLIYLNHTCWNGLYRVNSRGEFNVPYGRPRAKGEIDRVNLRACAGALIKAKVDIRDADFAEALVGVSKGDLVFLDPPYVTKHNNNGFVDYNERLFAWKDQERLAGKAAEFANSGATVIVANGDHRDIVELYPGFESIRVSRSSTLANNVDRRGVVTELLLVKRG